MKWLCPATACAALIALCATQAAAGPSGNKGVFSPNKTAPAVSAPSLKTEKTTKEPRGNSTDPWPGGLNACFGARLEQPDYSDVLAALTAYANRQTLRNIEPREALQRVKSQADAIEKRYGKEAIRPVVDLYENMVRWQLLEMERAQATDTFDTGRLVDIVEAQAKLDPDFDDARRKDIIETIRSRNLFAPSTVLFRSFILPYRPLNIPPGCRVLEFRGKPEFTDIEHEARAVFDFLSPPGPICRADFDTAGSTEVRLESSKDGQQYALIQQWTSAQPGGVQGPVLPSKPVDARFLRITAVSAAESAVLRNPRVFALKPAAATESAYTAAPPKLDADFKEPAWPRKAQAEGFVLQGEDAFAEAQTTIRIAHDADALYIAAYLREPRMDTLAAQEHPRDAALWEEESFEVLASPPQGPLYRFVLNARGSQFDSMNGDASWDSSWRAAVKDYPTGWAAELAIPFPDLIRAPREGETWRIEFIRHRCNVAKENSSWSGSPNMEDAPLGEVRFSGEMTSKNADHSPPTAK